MKNWLKRHPFLFLFLFLIVGSASLNYSGFCFSQARWLSDEEKIRIAISEANKRDRALIVQDDGNRISVKRIPYKSLEDFLEKNDKCCSVKDYTEESRPFTFGDRILGFGGEVVSLQFQENYYNAEDQIKFKNIILRYAITDCGMNAN